MEATAEITAAVKNVPALRFPEFKGEWEKVPLKDRMDIFRGASPRPKGDPRYYGGSVPRLMIQDVTRDGKYAYPCIDYLTEEGAKLSRYLKAGSVVLSCSGTVVAIPGILGIDACIHDGFLGFRNFKETFDEYLYYLFVKLHEKLQGEATTGGVFNNLTTDIARNLIMGFPSLAEQQKIVLYLSTVDDKIQQLSKKKELLEKYKKGVMQQLFSQQIRFKDDNGNDFPEWEEKELSQVAKRVTLKNKKNDINFVLTNSATQGIVSQQDYFEKDIANQENLEGYYVVDVDDFVYNPRISTAAPVGPIKRNKLAKGVMSPLYTVFRFEKQNLEFLEFFFETTVWHRYMKSVANYGARHDRMSITNDDLLGLPIPIPCRAEQQKITAFLSAVENKLYFTTTQLDQAQLFKKGLLQKMFV
ncbi:restriction endonuclease subunit S [Pontibacter litorisediminis]|uniref:restriction endonuclease subunit S n=1 Tax=Pontibacter litorisediminis TaxID=1846260 RepID=UPI0023EA90C6|nr:restriction endonuclease subunit S [Pontibacter litorisediminis]